MTRETNHLERFLRRVHRRWVLLRAVESAGVGAAIGCAAALALVPVLLWRDRPAVSVALTLMAVAGAAGLLFGLTRRPTLHAAAVEADRQLDLHDLLASALASLDSNDGWGGAVVAHAEARCRTLSPDAILLNRLGVRAWSGIGLAAALVLTLSLLSAQPETLSASDRAGAAHRAERPSRVAAQDPERTAISSDDATAARVGEPSHVTSHQSPTGDDSSAPSVRSSDAVSGSSNGSSGGGVGAARTDDSALRNKSEPSDPSHRPRAPTAITGQGDRTSAGGGGPGNAAGAGDDKVGVGSTAASAAPTAPVAPWSSPTWHDARRDARDAIERGRVRDEYRELIRDYFDSRQR